MAMKIVDVLLTWYVFLAMLITEVDMETSPMYSLIYHKAEYVESCHCPQGIELGEKCGRFDGKQRQQKQDEKERHSMFLMPDLLNQWCAGITGVLQKVCRQQLTGVHVRWMVLVRAKYCNYNIHTDIN